jgi:phosphatidylserine decarboxylase
VKITPYGAGSVALVLSVSLAVIAVAVFFIDSVALQIVVILVCLAVDGLILNFFRDPERLTPKGIGLVISPADGKVVVIKEVQEPEFLHGSALQVSIFMSPLDVHVNRIPVSGTVGHFHHIPGSFGVAFDDKASEYNERTCIGIEGQGVKILFRQIAGALARRIVADLKVGQSVTAGERFGMIKLGSRVDIFMPAGSRAAVAMHQQVAAGETVLAHLPGSRAD